MITWWKILSENTLWNGGVENLISLTVYNNWIIAQKHIKEPALETVMLKAPKWGHKNMIDCHSVDIIIKSPSSVIYYMFSEVERF